MGTAGQGSQPGGGVCATCTAGARWGQLGSQPDGGACATCMGEEGTKIGGEVEVHWFSSTAGEGRGAVSGMKAGQVARLVSQTGRGW